VDREITLRDYGRVLWSGRWLIVAAVVVAALVGVILTFVTRTTYTATAQVYLGQATTTSGVPVSTYVTNPATVSSALRGDQLIAQVAHDIGVSPSRVRRDVTLSAPRAPGASAGNQPTVLTITFQDRSRSLALDGANAYAKRVMGIVGGSFQANIATLASARDTAKSYVDQLQRQIATYQRQIQAGVSDPTRLAGLQTLLLSATQQLGNAQINLSDQQLAYDKAQQIEQPTIISLAKDPDSSKGAPNRARTVVIAALIGLIVGIIVTFVWRGSPAGRAGAA
jgi:uncharacterized protein involved in exopolysaccharide biosynthesis